MNDKEPTLIDGFASVQAIKRSGRSPSAPARLRHSATSLPAPGERPRDSPPTPIAGVAKIGHTAVRHKHDMVCYACNYAFTVSGKVHFSFCPKCKQQLNMSDEVVSGNWTDAVKTMGTIEVAAGAVVRGALLLAQNIVVAGDVTQATLQVSRRLELADGAQIDWRRITMQTLVIRAGAAFSFEAPLTCRSADIAGTLQAELRADERIILRATSCFEGELYSPCLQVEDGASIRARMILGRTVAAAMPHKQHAA